MKEKILKLRKEGKSYREINKILGCSKGTIAYHCGKGQKEKTKIRRKTNSTSIKHKLNGKIDCFLSRGLGPKGVFTYIKRTEDNKKYYDKIINNPICYLTGRKINLSESKSYQLDHIIPTCKGGDNSLENMGLTCKEANEAKSGLLKDDFIKLCKEIIKNNK